jgi:hypothetical protein
MVVLERIRFLMHLQTSFRHTISGKHFSVTDCSIVYDASYHETITYVYMFAVVLMIVQNDLNLQYSW